MEKDKRLMEASWWKRLTEGEPGSCSDGRGHAQKIFNLSFCWWVGLCSPRPSAIYLGPNYGESNKDNGDLLQNVPCTHCYTQCPQTCIRPLPTHASAGDFWHSWASLGQSLAGSLLLSSGSWCAQGSICAFLPVVMYGYERWTIRKVES